MILMAIVIAILSAIMFGIAVCIIAGGVTGFAIIADVLVFVLSIGFCIKILADR